MTQSAVARLCPLSMVRVNVALVLRNAALAAAIAAA